MDNIDGAWCNLEYTPVDVGTHFIHHWLGAVAQELIGVGHIVNVDGDAWLYWRSGPPSVGLSARPQCHLVVHDRVDQAVEVTGDQCSQNEQTDGGSYREPCSLRVQIAIKQKYAQWNVGLMDRLAIVCN